MILLISTSMIWGLFPISNLMLGKKRLFIRFVLCVLMPGSQDMNWSWDNMISQYYFTSAVKWYICSTLVFLLSPTPRVFSEDKRGKRSQRPRKRQRHPNIGALIVWARRPSLWFPLCTWKKMVHRMACYMVQMSILFSALPQTMRSLTNLDKKLGMIQGDRKKKDAWDPKWKFFFDCLKKQHCGKIFKMRQNFSNEILAEAIWNEKFCLVKKWLFVFLQITLYLNDDNH